MKSHTRDKIIRILDDHRIMTVATLRPDGWPQATTVNYVNDRLRLYFLCARDSQKAANLARDERTSLTIDRDTNDPMSICGLSMAARAKATEDSEKIARALMVCAPKKYPEYAPLMNRMSLKRFAVFEVTPLLISVLDYTKGFGHTELVEIGPSDL